MYRELDDKHDIGNGAVDRPVVARAYQDLERYDEAIEVAKRITQLDADDILAHTSLSILYQKKGMVPEAEAEANTARVLDWKRQLKKK